MLKVNRSVAAQHGESVFMALSMYNVSAAHPPRIIVADDHEWIRQILVEVVRQTLPGAEIIATADGLQALAAYRSGGCDFLVSNHCMPRLDGVGLIRAVREHAPTLPILMVSVKPEAQDDAIVAGANWFLTKEQIMECMPALLLRHASRGATALN